MGSSVSNAAKSVVGSSVVDATKKGWKQYGVYVGGGGTTALTNAAEGYRRDGGSGIQAGVTGTASQAIEQPRQLINPEDPEAAIPGAPDPAIMEADPAARRKRLLEARAGTILTAGADQPGGTNLGGTGRRSSLLGL